MRGGVFVQNDVGHAVPLHVTPTQLHRMHNSVVHQFLRTNWQNCLDDVSAATTWKGGLWRRSQSFFCEIILRVFGFCYSTRNSCKTPVMTWKELHSKHTYQLLGIVSAHCGNDVRVWKGVIGQHGDADVKDNGRPLLQLLCCNNALSITPSPKTRVCTSTSGSEVLWVNVSQLTCSNWYPTIAPKWMHIFSRITTWWHATNVLKNFQGLHKRAGMRTYRTRWQTLVHKDVRNAFADIGSYLFRELPESTAEAEVSALASSFTGRSAFCTQWPLVLHSFHTVPQILQYGLPGTHRSSSTVLHIRATVLVPSMHVVFTSAKYLSLCFLKVTCFFLKRFERPTLKFFQRSLKIE